MFKEWKKLDSEIEVQYKGMSIREIQDEKLAWAASLPEPERSAWTDFYYAYWSGKEGQHALELLSQFGTLDEKVTGVKC